MIRGKNRFLNQIWKDWHSKKNLYFFFIVTPLFRENLGRLSRATLKNHLKLQTSTTNEFLQII